jgi:dienelactone hydrolase
VATVVLFHSVLGVRPGVLDAADRLRADGHEVVVPDLFGGRTFDEYGPAMSYAWEELGIAALTATALDAVDGLPDDLVSAGFSLGCVMAVHVATSRPVSRVLMVAGAVPPSGFGDGRSWPAGVPAQTHATFGDPWRDDEELAQTVRDVEAGGGSIEVFDYPGSSHLWSDPSLPAEYDPTITEQFWARALPFVRGGG